METVNADGTRSYTSGRINTQGKHDFKYGYFECRAKVPTGKGYLLSILDDADGRKSVWTVAKMR